MVAGHKLDAPEEIGASYIRNGTKLDKYIHAAGQEQGVLELRTFPASLVSVAHAKLLPQLEYL